jgi:hypothetical protein
MVRVFVSFDVFGDMFSPQKAELATGLAFQKKRVIGELGTYGRYKGQPYPHGSGTLEFSSPSGLSDPTFLTWMGRIKDHLEDFTNAGATRISFMINVGYIGECKLKMEAPVVKALAGLGLGIGLTFYESD